MDSARPDNVPDHSRQRARSQARLIGSFHRNDDGDNGLCARWTDTDHGRLANLLQLFDRLLGAHGCQNAVCGRDDVCKPALHPEPSVRVEMPDVAGAVPARGA